MTIREAQEILADSGYRSLADFSPITSDEWLIVQELCLEKEEDLK